MGKPKALLKKSQKPPKGKPQPLQTADEFQDAADAEEETGGKWRAGDQAKSCRAFLRAIQIYDDGLKKHPKNFDLAYNKARLEFDLTQQATLVPKLPMPVIDLLQQALISHRYALSLNEQNADVLFNTAQVMISIAEIAVDNGSQPDAALLLREALEILNACLSRQEMLREEQRMRFTDEANEGGVPVENGVMGDDATTTTTGPSEGGDDSAETEEQYVTIQADITDEDLLDTARASVTALTLLVSLEDATIVSTLAQMAYSLTDKKIPHYLQQLEVEPTTRSQIESEVSLERAEFIAALANAEYKFHSISLEDVLSRFQVFQQFDLATNVPAMCICADALVEFASTSQTFSSSSSSHNETIRWTQLTKAQDLYSRAVRVDNQDSRDRKALIYESRGDVELLRFRLAGPSGLETSSGLSDAIRSSAPTLVKNAGVYYRGAANLYRADGDADAASKADIRGLVSRVVDAKVGGGQGETEVAALKQRGDAAVNVAVDMLREGLLSSEWDLGV